MSEEAPKISVRFFIEPTENEVLSRKASRPIFEDREMVELRYPGDGKRTHRAPANEKYRRDPNMGWVTYAEDFPKHYELFKQGLEQSVEGTPLSELTFLTESKRAELRAINIHVAEQLAELDGALLQRIGMGARELKDKAVAFIERANAGAADSRMASENEALRNELARLSEMVEAMQAAKADTKLEDLDTAELKAVIKEKTGQAPRGNPSHETLVSLARGA